MLLTITTTHAPADELGFLLHKNPAAIHERDLPFGTARVCYPVVDEHRCTAALSVDVDPVSLVRDRATGQSRGFAFVEMASEDGARAAIDQFHEKELDGRRLTVNEARPQEPRGDFGGGRGRSGGGGGGGFGGGGGSRRREPRW